MRRTVGIGTALLVMLTISGGWAEEIKGKIKLLDTQARTFALEDGIRIWVAEGLRMDTLREGLSVRATYETRDGNRIATSIEAE